MATFSQGHVAGADRLLLVFSDIEMGAGGLTDDFARCELLGELLAPLNDAPYASLDIDLIFNGDTFDFLKVSVDGAYPHLISAEIAQKKLASVANAHRPFIQSIQDFLDVGHGRRQVHFVVGNHDLELLFPEVQSELRSWFGDDERVCFPGLSMEIGDVYIEHGHQTDGMFAVDPDALFLESEHGPILNLPWGCVGLLEAIMPLHPVLCQYDRIKPKEKLMQLLPEMRELFTVIFWRYWTRDYWKGFWRGSDPLKKMTWQMFKEIVSRLRNQSVEISPSRQIFQQRLLRSETSRLFVLGHEHDAYWWSYGTYKLLQTGCFRDEYMLEGRDEEPSLSLIPKTYATIWIRDGRAVRSSLVEVDGFPPKDGVLPASIYEIVPIVQQLLGDQKLRKTELADREAQEVQEEADAQQKLSRKAAEAEAEAKPLALTEE